MPYFHQSVILKHHQNSIGFNEVHLNKLLSRKMANKNNYKEEPIEEVENALSRTELFIEENQKSLIIIISAIIILVGGYLGYKKFIVAPKEKEALSQMFVAEQYFEKDNYKEALNGDGNYLGFKDIIDEYGITKAAKLAQYYSGICCLHLGQYQEAIDHLKKFETKDKMLGPIAIGAMGDAYAELGNLDKAVQFYQKAASKNENDFTAPIYLMKAGQVFEEMGKYDKALEMYQKIDYRYPKTMEGRQVEKYITRAKLKSGK